MPPTTCPPARCDVCVLRVLHEAAGTAPAPLPLTPASTRAPARVLLVGLAPSGLEAEQQLPLLGQSGRALWDILHNIRVTRTAVSVTHLIACPLLQDDYNHTMRRCREHIKRIKDKSKIKGRIGHNRIRLVRGTASGYGFYPHRRTLCTSAPKRVLPAILRRIRHIQGQLRQAPLLMPLQACRPRVLAEVADHDALILLGSEACRSILKTRLSAVRGGPWPAPETRVPDWLRNKRVLATHSPQRAYRDGAIALEEFRRDIPKAIAWATGQQDWMDVPVKINPTMAWLHERLHQWTYFDAAFRLPAFGAHAVVSFDFETLGIDTTSCQIRTCAFDDGQHPFVLVWQDLTGVPAATQGYLDDLNHWMRTLVATPNICKVGWNSGGFDLPLLERFGPVVNHVDAMVLDRIADSEVPHSLWYAASRDTGIWPWKAEHAATEAKTVAELARYNQRDARVTRIVTSKCAARVQTTGGTVQYKRFAALQTLARSAECLPVWIDPVQLSRLTARLERDRDQARADWQDAAPGVSPTSAAQVGKLLYDTWALPVLRLTDGGAPSTDEASLIQLYGSPLTAHVFKPAILALRRIRAAEKLLTTCLYKWQPGTRHPRWNDWIVDPEGRAHFSYIPTGTVGWRWASAGVFGNVQNIRRSLRSCFRAGPDASTYWYTFDAEALELRMIAALANERFYLDVFERNDVDAHNKTLLRVMGEDFCRGLTGAPKDLRDKGADQWAELRDLIKRQTYHGIYRGAAEALHDVLLEVELERDGRTVFPYADMSLPEISALLNSWRALVPGICAWWRAQDEQFQARGYVVDPVWGLRRHLRADAKNLASKVVNTPVQSGGAAMLHQGALSLFLGADDLLADRRRTAGSMQLHPDAAPLPFDFRRGHGMVHQGHDSVSYLGSAEFQEQIMFIMKTGLERCGDRRIPGLPVDFPFEGKFAPHWQPPACDALLQTPTGVRECLRDTKWDARRGCYVCACNNTMSA